MAMPNDLSIRLSQMESGQPSYRIPKSKSVLQPIEKLRRKIVQGRDQDYVELNVFENQYKTSTPYLTKVANLQRITQENP